MSLKLPPDLAKILRDVITNRRPELANALDSSEQLTPLERETMRQAIADELTATGLQEDDEPNTRGRLLEEIIDRIGHL